MTPNYLQVLKAVSSLTSPVMLGDWLKVMSPLLEKQGLKVSAQGLMSNVFVLNKGNSDGTLMGDQRAWEDKQSRMPINVWEWIWMENLEFKNICIVGTFLEDTK